MSEFQAGDRVIHPVFGLGRVASGEKDGILRVDFDAGQAQLVALKHVLLHRISAEEEAALAATSAASFADTFSFEDEDADADHTPGAHWHPFYDDVGADILPRLPELLRKARLARTLSDFDTWRPPPLPADWPKAAALRWPELPGSMHFVIRMEAEANVFSDMFPVIDRGTQARLKIHKVHVWHNRVEAQIEVSLGLAQINFFDTDFVGNAGWYRTGVEAEFILCGLAYACARAADESVELPDREALMRAMRELGEDPVSLPLRINSKGLAALLPMVKGDRDEYEFHGTVQAVDEVDMLDRPGWSLTVRVLRSLDAADRVLDLRILVMRRVWQETTPPQPGDDVIGTLWLQGRLWAAPQPT